MGHFWVRRGPEMIVCHRPLTSLNMSPYRPIWTHFRQIFMIFIDLILQTGKAAGIWASCLDPRPIFNDFLKTKKMCNVRTINLAVVSSHIEPYGPISDQISWFPGSHISRRRRRRRLRRRRRRTNPQIPTWPLSQRTQGSNTSQGPLLRSILTTNRKVNLHNLPGSPPETMFPTPLATYIPHAPEQGWRKFNKLPQMKSVPPRLFHLSTCQECDNIRLLKLT